MEGFAEAVIDWFHVHGRHDLPWQAERSPYRVWVSEVMLQQTRVDTVVRYFARFIERFPDVASLAAADADQVLHLWTGLGYYSRVRNLHAAAKTIVATHHGQVPNTLAGLTSLAGIGRSTAGAILALAFGKSAAILDANVKRVLARCFAIEGYPADSRTAATLWQLAEQLVPREPAGVSNTKRLASGVARTMEAARPTGSGNQVAAYTQGMMDLGAGLCTHRQPACPNCPLHDRCLARARDQIALYPGRKPARKLPVRTVTMFVLQDRAGRILLEKRPPNGVWGSLYSLPQVDGREETRLPAGLPHVRLQDGQPEHLASMRHGFTHFLLDISPVRYQVAETGPGVADSNRWLWYSSAEPVEVGLAAPAKKLLAAMAATRDTP